MSDLNELNWDITIEDIQQMKKKRFLNIVKRKVQNKSFKDLLKIKEKHSKVKCINHKMLQMQNFHHVRFFTHTLIMYHNIAKD